MAFNAVGFVLGSVVFFSFSDLPPLWFYLLGVLVGVLAVRPYPPLSWCVIGYLLAAWHSTDMLASTLNDRWLYRDVMVTGVVSGLPVQDSQKARFLFLPEQICHKDGHTCGSLSGVITRLSWYRDYPELSAGQRWQFKVKLREPHGFMNPGGFDFEKWMFHQRVAATGYVRGSEGAIKLNIVRSPSHTMQSVRSWLKQRLELATQDLNQRGLIMAIAIGDRSGINHEQWQQFIATGTNHLLAISGLHISLVAAFAAFVAQTVWKKWRVCQRVPRQALVLAVGFCAGLLYSGLAGFSVPTQRAILMFGVVVVLDLTARHQSRQRSLLLALALVCAMDPLVVLSAGYWMSFSAVAILFAVYNFVQNHGRQQRIVMVMRGHLLITIGLYPVGILFFGHMSLVSPLANFIAVPIVGMLLTPMIFCASLVSMLSVSLAHYLLIPVDWLFSFVEMFLAWVSAWKYALRFIGAGGGLTLLWSIALAGLCLLPVPWRMRWLFALMALPLFFSSNMRPEQGTYEVTFLDVGQGTSVVVQTASHVLVYDTGAKFSESFNAANAVILPFLRNRGIERIDRLVISHPDGDHSGGTEAILEGIEVGKVLVSSLMDHIDTEFCRSGQRWWWDGVLFEILQPDDAARGSTNDKSCVLLVTASDSSRTLLAGDIEARGERRLVEYGLPEVDVLLAPHHGSSTSSGPAFVAAANPEFVVHTTGYRNRYGFPHQQVIDAYQAIGASQFNTAISGAVTFNVGVKNGINVNQYRLQHRALWHQTFAEGQLH